MSPYDVLLILITIITSASPKFFMSNLEFNIVSPRVPLVEVLMITNQGYWLLMIKVELSDRVELIKHQMKII